MGIWFALLLYLAVTLVIIVITKIADDDTPWPLLIPVAAAAVVQIIMPASIWAGVVFAASFIGVIVCWKVRMFLRGRRIKRRQRKVISVGCTGELP